MDHHQDSWAATMTAGFPFPAGKGEKRAVQYVWSLLIAGRTWDQDNALHSACMREIGSGINYSMYIKAYTCVDECPKVGCASKADCVAYRQVRGKRESSSTCT